MTTYNEDSWEAAAEWVITRNGLSVPPDGFPGFVAQYEHETWVELARAAWFELDQWSVPEMVALLSSKQHDYGHLNITKFGEQGVKVRLWDKIARFNNLYNRGAHLQDSPQHESLEDTLKDIIGYVTILLMVKAGTFTLPLEADL